VNPKSAALASVTSELTGDLCFFFDADISVDDVEFLRRVASLVERSPTTLVSVQPYHATGRAVESLALFPNVLALLGSGAMRYGRARRCESAAFGPFLCVDVDTYRRFGGHGAILGASLDDVALARLYSDQGGCVVVAAGGRHVSFRMYPEGLWQIIEGFTKNLALGARQVNRVTSAAAVVWFAGLVAVTEHLFVGEFFHGVVTWSTLVEYVAFVAQVGLIGWRIGRYRLWVYLALPIAEVFVIALVARSGYLLSIRRSVLWRGRRLGIGE
jgi:4,4'-diaponeurosporenoate glycosyltransferase